MNEPCVWHIVKSLDPVEAADSRFAKVAFLWPGRAVEEFTRSQLRATIDVLRLQELDTEPYQDALDALTARDSVV
jgi:hypothetical protein